MSNHANNNQDIGDVMSDHETVSSPIESNDSHESNQSFSSESSSQEESSIEEDNENTDEIIEPEKSSYLYNG